MTDGHKSFCLFIYNCDLLQTHGAAIGFSASGNFSFNHRKANTYSSNEVGCSNRPESDWNTLVYALHYDGRYITIEHDLAIPFVPTLPMIQGRWTQCHGAKKTTL